MKYVIQRELAAALGLTTQQIYNLRQKGLPKVTKRGKTTYPLSDCINWYIDFKRRRRDTPIGSNSDEVSDLRLQKLRAEVRLSELDLAEREGLLVSIDYLEEQLTAALTKLRHAILNLPGRAAPQILGIKTESEGQLRLQPILSKIIELLDLDD